MNLADLVIVGLLALLSGVAFYGVRSLTGQQRELLASLNALAEMLGEEIDRGRNREREG